MAGQTESHLRNPPRQARSAARVKHLLDVAEVVFEDVGYDAATTNEIAARAKVPVGTLYRWFPDKGALAEALTDRYLDQLVGIYTELLGHIDPGERIGDFLHRVMARLVTETRDQKALSALLVSALVPGRRSHAGERLRSGLEGHIRALVEMRVPGIPEDLRDRTASVAVSISCLILAAADDDGPNTQMVTDEYVDVLLAYLEAKFPSPGHPAWTDPDVAVKPLFPAPQRATRLAAASAHRETDPAGETES